MPKPPKPTVRGPGEARDPAIQAVVDELRPIVIGLMAHHGQAPVMDALMSIYITAVRLGDQDLRNRVAEGLRLAADTIVKPDDDLSVAAPQGKA